MHINDVGSGRNNRPVAFTAATCDHEGRSIHTLATKYLFVNEFSRGRKSW
jgi:hypothetical protein